MTREALRISPLADISSSMLAAFVILLVMAAAAPRGPGAAEKLNEPLSEAQLDATQRRASSSADLVKALFDRRPTASGASIDLMDAQARLVVDGGPPQTFDLRDPSSARRLARLAAPATVAPVRLYVFSSRHYAAIAHALSQDDLGVLEVSTPAALRRADGDDWSADFMILAGRSHDLNQFADDLAQLLNGGRNTNGAAVSANDKGFAWRAWDGVVARLRRLWRALLLAFKFAAPAAILALIEAKTRRVD